MYAISGYVGSKASEFIDEKINSYIEVFDLYSNLKTEQKVQEEEL